MCFYKKETLLLCELQKIQSHATANSNRIYDLSPYRAWRITLCFSIMVQCTTRGNLLYVRSELHHPFWCMYCIDSSKYPELQK